MLLDCFRRMNDRAKRTWLGLTCTMRMQMEKRLWEIVEGRGGEVEVGVICIPQFMGVGFRAMAIQFLLRSTRRCGESIVLAHGTLMTCRNCQGRCSVQFMIILLASLFLGFILGCYFHLFVGMLKITALIQSIIYTGENQNAGMVCLLLKAVHLNRVQEVAFARDIVKLALECKSYLTEIVNHALDHHDKDLGFVSESLQRALKSLGCMVIFKMDAS